ncbi:MAG: hypothetical protein HY721_32165 [Planctomycetes bacterium]|nr:hypothetical protein [Planctomycetota bacterium]
MAVSRADPAVRYCKWCHAELGDASFECPRCRMSFNPGDGRSMHSPESLIAARSWLLGVVLSTVLGVFTYWTLWSLAGDMGPALFISVPAAMGAALGYVTRLGLWLTAAASLFVIAIFVGALLTMNVAGLFCGSALGVIAVGPFVLGLLLGKLLRTLVAASPWARRRYLHLPATAFFLLPLAHGAQERLSWGPQGVTTVFTEQAIDAPANDVWREIVFFEEVESEPPSLLRFGLPRPSHVEGRHEAPGDVATCVYEGGRLVKRITEVQVDERLAFAVIEQRLHFERDVTLLGGSFDLEDLGSAGTRLRITTEYRSHLTPRWIWEPLEGLVVRTLHGHVAAEIARRAAGARKLD